MAQRPDYIYTDSSPLQHTPMHLNASDMYGFFIKGDRSKLQAHVDATLNRVAAGRMRFKALSPYVIVTFTRVGHAQSSFPDDYNKGWGKETDIVTWVMVGEMDEEDNLQRLLSYAFHIWVDVPTAITIGREIFGYPKNMCKYTMPAPGEEPLQFELSSEGWQPFKPETELAIHPILEITAADADTAHRRLFGFMDLLREILKFLRSEEDALALDEDGRRDFESLLLRPRVDQVFLKQFPDGSGVKAVYQAVVVAPATVDDVHSVRLLGHKYECNVHAFDSFPLDKTLGFKLGPQRVRLPFHINFDFTVTAGQELLQALPQPASQAASTAGQDSAQSSPQAASGSKRKIAVLGGGVGAMSAAFHLTEQPGWRDRYCITVYQMGWRLGGKGASGRNAQFNQRVEEHGLHIWFGFYDNAFALMQRAYAELRRPNGAPLATWEDAFKPQPFIVLTENIGGEWKLWPIDTPLKDGVPGSGSEEITFSEIVATLKAWIRQWLRDLQHHLNSMGIEDAGERVGGLVKYVPEDFDIRSEEHRALQVFWLETMKKELAETVRHRLDTDDGSRHLYIAIDLAAVSVIGIFKDWILFRGFDAINDIDYRAWLLKHGADEKYTINSAPVAGLYDLVFAYVDGDFKQSNCEAGTMLRGILRIAICYHGAIMWKMQAGMGDTVFTPLYQVLKERGVKFEFFRKVEELIPDGDGVGEIVLTEQCALAEGKTEYYPLVDVGNLACWPSSPDYAQLNADQAKLLKAHNVNLESHWSDWPRIHAQHLGVELPVKRLKRGVHFDEVVFGLSTGSLPHVCPKLLDKSPQLKAAAEKVKTVATQAYQVWTNKSLRDSGWRYFGPNGELPVLSAFTQPFDTWAAMDQLLGHEGWPTGQAPESVSYFCTAMPMKDFPPPAETDFPERCAEAVKQSVLHHLQHEIWNLWPAVATPTSFDWQVLVDPANATGQARFDTQFWRANIDPSDLYVLSVVGSTEHRVRSETSGLSNFYPAGDWVKTGLNAGCVEAAVMGGMGASRAICGYPPVILGEHDG